MWVEKFGALLKVNSESEKVLCSDAFYITFVARENIETLIQIQKFTPVNATVTTNHEKQSLQNYLGCQSRITL
jgi:hypothetical protein